MSGMVYVAYHRSYCFSISSLKNTSAIEIILSSTLWKRYIFCQKGNFSWLSELNVSFMKYEAGPDCYADISLSL